MDFDKKAQQVLGSAEFHDRGGVPAIAAALKEYYNAGLSIVGDEAQRRADSLRKAREYQGGLKTVEANTYEALADSLAEYARAKKVPT